MANRLGMPLNGDIPSDIARQFEQLSDWSINGYLFLLPGYIHSLLKGLCSKRGSPDFALTWGRWIRKRLRTDTHSRKKIQYFGHWPARFDPLSSTRTTVTINSVYLWETVHSIRYRGFWGFRRVPFGLKNAPAHFQRAIDTIVGSYRYECALAFIDDIVIYSLTLFDHRRHVSLYWERWSEWGGPSRRRSALSRMRVIIRWESIWVSWKLDIQFKQVGFFCVRWLWLITEHVIA